MQRRGFLGLLAGFPAAAVLDPERLLWVRGAKTIFIPRARCAQVHFRFSRDTGTVLVSISGGRRTLSSVLTPNANGQVEMSTGEIDLADFRLSVAPLPRETLTLISGSMLLKGNVVPLAAGTPQTGQTILPPDDGESVRKARGYRPAFFD